MSSQRRLGRGLEALLGRSLDEPSGVGAAPVPSAPVGGDATPVADPPGSPTTDSDSSLSEDGVMTRDGEGQRWLDLGVIEANPFQPRKHFDEEQIADLADSLREHGMLQPLVVRRVDGRFELVAGERRLRAAQSLDWQRVPIQVRDVDDRQTAELALVENLQRSDLNAIEKATSFQRYLRDYDCTQEELARRVHINRATVANLVRLLDLPEAVKKMVVDSELTPGHARALLSLPADQQTKHAGRVAKEGLSVRKTEQLVQDFAAAAEDETLRVVGGDGVSRSPGAGRSTQLASLETELQATLGTKVQLTQNVKGAGKITLHFKNADEFERLHAVLKSDGQAASHVA